MANSMIIKEFLVALGIRDNFTMKFNRLLNQSTKQAKNFSKGLASAATVGAGFLFAANYGVAKFTMGLIKSDDALTQYAADIGKTKDEARTLKYALDAMGKSMEEIEASPELTATFKQLQIDAAAIKMPDMTDGLKQVREIQTEFLRLKQSGSYAVQWVGHYLVKYLQQPMEKLRGVFGGLNTSIIANMPEWSKKIASVMASVVNITASIIRAAAQIFNAIKRVFNMIPGEIKIVMGILTALALFIRAGPLGKLATVFSVLMLLVEDFFTYLDGGESLLGGFWQKLIDIWNELNKQGGVIENLKKGFTATMEAAVKAVNKVIEWVRNFWQSLKESDAINNFHNAFEKVGEAVSKIFTAIKDVVGALFGGLIENADSITPFLTWIISEAIPSAIGLIADIAGGIADVISYVSQIDGFKEVVLTVVAAIGAWKAIQLGMAAVQTILTAKQWLLNAAMTANPIGLIIAGIAALIAIAILLVKNWDTVKEFFIGLWAKIKDVFGGVGSWFKDKFETAKKNVVAAFTGVVDWIKDNWQAILLFLINPVSGFLKYAYDNFEGFRNFVDTIVAAIKEFFIGLWETVKGGVQDFVDTAVSFITSMVENWTQIINTITEFFIGVWDAVKEGVAAFVTAVIEFFTGLIENIFGIIGKVGGIFSSAWDKAKELTRAFVDNVLNVFKPLKDFIGGIGDKIKDIFGGKKTFEVEANLSASPPDTGHSEGGIFKKEHIARVSEGNQAEAIVPLTKPNRAKEVLTGVAEHFGINTGAANGNILNGIAANVGAAVQMLSGLSMSLNALNAGLSQSVQGANNTVINNYDNRNYSYNLPSNYTINDVSGNPQNVANAVSRTEQLKWRNLNGILSTGG